MLSPPKGRLAAAVVVIVVTLVLPTTGTPVAAQQNESNDDPVSDDGQNIGGDVRNQLGILESGGSGEGGGTPPPCTWTDENDEEHEDGIRRWRLTAVDQEDWGEWYEEWDIETGVVYRYECFHPSMCDGDPDAEDCYGELLIGEGWCDSAICYFDAINPPNIAVMLVEDSFLEELGDPDPQFSPPGGTTIVNFDTFMWIENNVPADGQEGPWSISIPGPMSVEASASLSEVVWDMGEGGEPVTCPITTDEASAEQEGCLYSYERSSAGEPGGEFEGEVSVVWTVEWNAEILGQSLSGEIDAPRDNTFSLAVAEGQAIVTDD